MIFWLKNGSKLCREGEKSQKTFCIQIITNPYINESLNFGFFSISLDLLVIFREFYAGKCRGFHFQGWEVVSPPICFFLVNYFSKDYSQIVFSIKILSKSYFILFIKRKYFVIKLGVYICSTKSTKAAIFWGFLIWSLEFQW